jgi:hypothetical protein
MILLHTEDVSNEVVGEWQGKRAWGVGHQSGGIYNLSPHLKIISPHPQFKNFPLIPLV